MDTDNKILIITHNGQFHADEVLACGILMTIFPDATICRSRDPTVISTGNFVVDVGMVYDPLEGKFDHHQEDCADVYSSEHSVPMSSAGMVYKEYGYEFLRTLFDKEIKKHHLDVKSIMDTLYRAFVLEIDAIDNGIKQADKYSLNYTTYTNLSSTISKLNTDDIFNPDVQDAAFYDAIKYAMLTFNIHAKNFVDKAIGVDRDYKVIQCAMENRSKHSLTGEIVVIPCDCPNWLYCLRSYENKNLYTKPDHSIKYVIYPSDGTEWRLRAMPDSERFINRKNIKSLDEILKHSPHLEKDIVFIHDKKFVGGAKNLTTAIKMAQISLLQ